MSNASSFFVMFNGQIESAHYPSNIDNLYCRYSFTQGLDWTIIHGVVEGFTQLATGRNSESNGIVWNFPIDITFKSTNAFGWPKVTLAVFGLDWLGRDIVRGYGSFFCPTVPGHHSIHVHTYAPTANSLWKRCLNWIQGMYPEFYDYNFIAQGEGRAVTNVRSEGMVKIALDVTMKGVEEFGYSFCSNSKRHMISY